MGLCRVHEPESWWGAGRSLCFLEKLHVERTSATQCSSLEAIPNCLIKLDLSSQPITGFKKQLPSQYWITVSAAAQRTFSSRNRIAQHFCGCLGSMFHRHNGLFICGITEGVPHSETLSPRGQGPPLCSFWCSSSVTSSGLRKSSGLNEWAMPSADYGTSPYSCNSQEIRSRSWWLFTAWLLCTSLWTCMRWLKTAIWGLCPSVQHGYRVPGRPCTTRRCITAWAASLSTSWR